MNWKAHLCSPLQKQQAFLLHGLICWRGTKLVNFRLRETRDYIRSQTWLYFPPIQNKDLVILIIKTLLHKVHFFPAQLFFSAPISKRRNPKDSVLKKKVVFQNTNNYIYLFITTIFNMPKANKTVSQKL